MLLIAGDCREKLAEMQEDSVDACVTDPPYELNFMGKSWDRTGVSFDAETWKHVLRVLKPGGHLLCFGGTRTFHRIAVAIEDAGFEIRDTLSWLYGSGFPKSLDVSKAIDRAAGAEGGRGAMKRGGERLARLENGARDGGGTWGNEVNRNPYTYAPATDDARQWDGWGTALKPAWEPIILARKPLSERTVAANVLTYGTGAINIDATRVPTTDTYVINTFDDGAKPFGDGAGHDYTTNPQPELGRWPANVLLDEISSEMLDRQGGHSKSTRSMRGVGLTSADNKVYGKGNPDFNTKRGHDDEGGVSRFFYCSKASVREREEGLTPVPGERRANKHPTVKPLALMQYLVTLITPPGGLVIDPFMGSGSTGCVAASLGVEFVGIDLDPNNIPLAEARITYWTEHAEDIAQRR